MAVTCKAAGQESEQWFIYGSATMGGTLAGRRIVILLFCANSIIILLFALLVVHATGAISVPSVFEYVITWRTNTNTADGVIWIITRYYVIHPFVWLRAFFCASECTKLHFQYLYSSWWFSTNNMDWIISWKPLFNYKSLTMCSMRSLPSKRNPWSIKWSV